MKREPSINLKVELPNRTDKQEIKMSVIQTKMTIMTVIWNLPRAKLIMKAMVELAEP